MTATAAPTDTDPRIGRRPRLKLGVVMHHVENPVYPCPVGCLQGTSLTVYAAAVQWPCGHTRDIPRIDPSCYPTCCHQRARLKAVA